MKILIFGSLGQLGQQLYQDLQSYGDVIGISRKDIDITHFDQCYSRLKEIHPDLIINCTAYTQVDRAENEETLADLVNHVFVGHLAQFAETFNVPLIHFSTDYVFDGKNYQPYRETDSTNPLNVYGKTKLAGEKAILRTESHHLIFRTSWVYGRYGQTNFVKTMLKLGHDREELRIVSDQIGTPTSTAEISHILQLIIPHIRDISKGVYHLSNSGVTSWYDFALNIFKLAKIFYYPLKVERVIPIFTDNYPTLATRPLYSVLSKQKLSQVLDYYPTHWVSSLEKMFSSVII